MSLRGTFGGLRNNKGLSAVILEGFFARLGFGIITFALPFYALSLGMSFTEVGVLSALRLVGAIIFKPAMGRLADRIGKKRLYLYSIAGRALVGLLFVFAYLPWMLFVIRFLHGVTTAARDPSSAVLIAELGDDKKMATAFSWYNAAKEAGASIGYLCAGFLLTYTADDYRLVFGISVVTSLIAWAFVAAWVHEPPVVPETDQAANAESNSKIAMFEIAVLGFLIAATGSMLTNLFPIVATEYARLSKAETSVIFTASTVLMVLFNPLFGWLSDHVGRGVVLSVRAFGNAVSSIIYAFFPAFWGFTLARVADDAGKAAFRPAWGALMADISGKKGGRGRARKVAYLDTAQTLGDGIGPIFAGLLWDTAGAYALFGARFVLAIVTEIYSIWALRRVERRKRDSGMDASA